MTDSSKSPESPKSPRKYGHWIDGAWHAPEQGHYQITDPATEEVVGHAPEGHAAEVWTAARAARTAFHDWSRADPRERAAVLERIGALISERADELVPLVRAETGATTRVARSLHVLAAADCFRRTARAVRESGTAALAPHPVAASPLADGGLIGAAAVRRPLGVVACITSHNFPVAQLVGMVAPALAMGNTVVAKPAPQDPLGFLELGPILKEAGLPDGVFNVVVGSGPITNEAVIAHYDIDLVGFSGSAAVGKRIAVSASGQLKRAVLELGGKGTAVVLEDADEQALESAIRTAGLAFSLHSGQTGTAPARMLVHRTLYGKAVDALTTYARSATVGSPADDSTVVGPLISDAQRDRVEAYVEDARRQGARITTGGDRPQIKPGFYAAPTVLADVTPDMPIALEEISGPVVAVIPFDDEAEAVRIATRTPTALHDYVFSADPTHARHLATRLRSANVGVNTAQQHPETPVVPDCGPFGSHGYSEAQSITWRA
ncbi:aldehyde dehydrogenase [Streptomyces sp. SA15]|uniref:aldehyde dehydrogenase family protein n=1 Tax=Streptomyces sp. SA15 TaxID=934019 RepID=UPI000BAE9D8F|nr:aldehyde dehydrogenase family protein [Streptomyces sp. SA15]PAZ12145.1 aldehyde dehydrogenase [Streptomyces sp. SA15]